MSIVDFVRTRVRELVHRGLVRDEGGAVSVEYIAVFGVVTIGLTLALIKLGPGLLTAWGQSQQVLLSSKP